MVGKWDSFPDFSGKKMKRWCCTAFHTFYRGRQEFHVLFTTKDAPCITA